MAEKLRVLIVEDSEDDALLILNEIKEGGYDPKFECVETKEAFLSALKKGDWDIIISDYSLPKFSGLDAVKLLKESGIDLPFILVSGAIGEEIAVKSFLAGAHDFIVKGKWERFVPAIKRELKEAKIRQEYKLGEEKLKKSEERYRSFMKTATDAIISADSDGDIIDWNNGAQAIFGYKEEDVLGKSLTMLMPERYRDAHKKGLQHAKTTDKFNLKRKTIELQGIRKDNSEFPMEVSFSKWQIGKDFFLSGIIRDITERKQLEESLKESEERYKDLFLKAPVSIILVDKTGQIIDVNPYHLSQIGKNKTTSKDYIGKNLITHPSVVNAGLSEHYASVLKGKPFDLKEVCVGATTGGTEAYLHVNGFPLSKSGKLFGAIFLHEDVTERKRLERMETRFGRMLETSLNEIYIFDAETLRFIQVNRGAQQNMGYSMDEFKEMTSLDIKPDFTLETFEKIRQPLRNGEKEIIQFTTVHRRKDGSFYPVEAHIQLSSGESSPVFVSIILDITKRKRDEEKLRKLSQAVEQSPASIIITDNKGNIEYVNPKFCQLTGYSCKEVIGQTPRFLKSGDKSPEGYKYLWDTIKSGKEWRGEFHNKKKNGELFWEQARISPIKDPDGKITHFLSIKEDITARKKADEKLQEKENQLHQAQKMEALGTLAGGIAHDFNNILTAIIGYTEITMAALPKESDLMSNLEQVYKAGERARDLVSHILTFSRQSEQNLLPVQLHLIFKEAIKLLCASIPSSIEIREDITKKDDVVNADPTQIHQIIMNLCTNASHAMEGKSGVLGIILQPFYVDKDFAASQTNLKEGKYVRLSVSDTGHGIDKTSIERIFDPFFTTKKDGEGTGLGLSVVYGIVQHMGGTITVHSELKKGTVFHIYFPRVDEDKTMETPVVESIRGGSETILLVDDEQIIVDLETKALKNLGYHVISTTDSLKALEIFQTLREKINLVITDQTMPNMTGDELARKLLSIRPDIPIILCTGFSQIMTEKKAKKIGIREFLKKPFLIKNLAASIRQVLD